MTRSATPTVPSGRAARDLADFIVDPAIDEPAAPASGDGIDTPLPGWFNAGRVSVAVPLFHAGLDGERVIDEVVRFARSVPAWEFLFIDDGSLDNTVPAFEKRLAALGFVDPGTAARLAIIPSAPHAGLGHVTRIAGLECDAEHLIVLMPEFTGDWSILSRLRDTLQSAHTAVAAAVTPGPLPVRLARRLAAGALGLAPVPVVQALAFQGPVAKALAERTRLRGPGFDLELLDLVRRMGLRTHVVAPTPHAASNAVASTRPSHWLGQVGSLLCTPLRVVCNRVLGRYRLHAMTSPAKAAPRRSVPRRKAS